MDEFFVQTITLDSGEEIIELDLNKGRKKKTKTYSNYMDDVEKLSKKENTSKEFITVVK